MTTVSNGASVQSTNGHVNPTGKALTPVFSPSGLLIAAVVDHTTIVVRDSETFDVVSYLQIPDEPSHIEFDPTGSLLLVCIPKRSCVSVYPLQVRGSTTSAASFESSATLTESLAGGDVCDVGRRHCRRRCWWCRTLGAGWWPGM